MSVLAQHDFELKLGTTSPVIAIIRGNVHGLADLLDWLADCGVHMVEITTNTPAWQDAVALAQERPFACVGVGTVLTKDHVSAAVAAGASFTVAPGLNADVVRACFDQGIAHIPGVVTPTEIQTAQDLGLSVLKLFPAGSMGVSYLKSLQGPFDAVQFVPTGGITPTNAHEWLDAGAVAVGLGGALTSGDAKGRENLGPQLRELCHRKVQ